MAPMELMADPAQELAWVVDRSRRGRGYTGYDAHGWDESAWVLHAMYEVTDQAAVVDDELDLAVEHLERSEDSCSHVSAVTRTVGGYLKVPGPGWRRLRWRDLETRSNGYLVSRHPDVPPGGRWFNTAHLPETLIAPPEGSLDEASLNALLAVLARHSPGGDDTKSFAYYAPITSWNMGDGRLFEGSLISIPDLIGRDDKIVSTPSNIWPQNRSWFVWTDWDLWATKVSGPRELMSALAAHPDLETCIWPAQTV